ncbi:MAG: aminopeptidase P family protein [Acidimicrobiales bacterium]|nr:MAG: aminopeptidase P family protein [Acidimicrobiales bacterium]
MPEFNLPNMRALTPEITSKERYDRRHKARELMRANGIDAVLLPSGTSLRYFTGLNWHPSERLVGAIMPSHDDEIIFISPAFEKATIETQIGADYEIRLWEEHENPYDVANRILNRFNPKGGTLGIEEQTPYFITEGIREACSDWTLISATPVTAGCRMQKSESELAIMQTAKNTTLDIHKQTAAMLREGITNHEVAYFIDQANRAANADNGSTFCIVSFGEATAYPHGPSGEQILKDGDMVLIDTGCALYGYNSDITRSYVFGKPNNRQQEVWNIEKEAQQAAFDAAQLGEPCEAPDYAARAVLEKYGFGPDYAVPGLPHRTGHGIGMDVHEWPYLVRGNKTPLAKGMCFSNEPMICIYGEFGIRLEDHFYMGDHGPKWFTQPSYSLKEPFKTLT